MDDLHNVRMLVRLLDQAARVPLKAHHDDAGLDLFALNDVTVYPGNRPLKVRTGVAVALPYGYGAWIQGRSGVTSRGLIIHQGLIDNGYHGELLVMASTVATGEPYVINAGDRIAQLVPFRVPELWVDVDYSDNQFSSSERGTNGFGSTGI